MRRTRILIAAVAVLVTITGGLTFTSRNDVADAAVVWHDDFDGAAGTGVDTSKWGFDTGGSGWGNQELQYYTSGTNNVAKDGAGHLVITARRQGGNSCWYGTCQWTSGRLLTANKFTQQYGHIEARIQVPAGSGLWPAFWMLGGGNWPTDGEIDIMEVVGRDPNNLFGTLHGPGYSGGNAYGGTRNIGVPWHQAFHTYAVDWSPNLIIWRVDGSEFFRATPQSLQAAKGNVSWVFNHGFFIIMNLAIGGNFGQGTPNTLPNENRMVIDYVHVDTADSGPTTPPTNPPGGGTLLSQGRPVTTSSSESAAFAAANAVDGNTGTRWSSAFSDPQWIQVDLGSTRTLNRVVLNWEAAAGRSYQIQTSTNGTTWTNAFSTTTGAGGNVTHAVSGSARYVRVNGTARTTQWGYSLWEFQVYGS